MYFRPLFYSALLFPLGCTHMAIKPESLDSCARTQRVVDMPLKPHLWEDSWRQFAHEVTENHQRQRERAAVLLIAIKIHHFAIFFLKSIWSYEHIPFKDLEHIPFKDLEGVPQKMPWRRSLRWISSTVHTRLGEWPDAVNIYLRPFEKPWFTVSPAEDQQKCVS